MALRSRNHCSVTNRNRIEKCRMNANRQQGSSKGECVQDGHCVDTHPYELDSPTENELKRSDERSSTDSFSYADTSLSPDVNEVDEHFREYATDMKQREKLLQNVAYTSFPNNKRAPIYPPQNYDDVPLRSNFQRKGQDYTEKKTFESATDPQAILALQRLEKLRELQRRRDYTEKFYSQKIKHLIGQQYFGSKGPSDPLQGARQQQEKFSVPPHYGEGRPPASLYENLQECGTMTTITELHCGCVEQLTRPIFTTTNGQRCKRSCAQEPQVHVNLSTPSTRLVFPTHVPQASTSKLKSKSFAEPKNNSPTGHNPTAQELRGRSSSPTRKLSDTSINSA